MIVTVPESVAPLLGVNSTASAKDYHRTKD
jgi:hypothetical protein